VTVLFSAAGLLGGWRWWRGEPSLWFWRLLRLAQVLLVVEAALGGVLVLMDRRPDDGLHYLYGLLPLAVSFVAEQLRLAAADTVLETRGLDSAQAVGRLPSAEQQSVVAAILRRELGVLAAGALVAAGLCVRAALT
jgi:heme A synthase